MTDSPFTARAEVEKLVYAKLSPAKFPKGQNGEYTLPTYDGFLRNVTGTLKAQYNMMGAADGLAKLLDQNSALASIKSTDHATAESILAKSKKEAEDDPTNKDDTPKITDVGIAQEKADRFNVYVQSITGAKEGVAKVIVEKVGANITDPVLKEPTTDEDKHVDDWTLFELLEAVQQGADRPAAAAILEDIVAVIYFNWNFAQKCTVNYKALKAKASQLTTYGLTMPFTFIAINIFANLEKAAAEPWGKDLADANKTLRRRYKYDYVHDETSIATIMTELAGADGVRNLSAATPIELGRAHAVSNSIAANSISQQLDAIQQAMQVASIGGGSFHGGSIHGGYASEYASDDDESSAPGYAAAVESDSESSGGATRRSSRKGKGKKNKSNNSQSDRRSGRARSRSPPPRDHWSKNPCKHCKKYKRDAQHPSIKEKDCMWNIKNKKWRPKYCCEEMEIPFVPRWKWKGDE